MLSRHAALFFLSLTYVSRSADFVRVGPQLSRTSLGNVLLKKKRFSADGQNIAQNCTTMRVVETMLYWIAASPPEEDLQPILREEVEIAVASLKKGKSAGVDNIPQNLFKLAGRP